MSAEKHTYSMKSSHTEAKKLEEMKNAIHRLQKTVGVDRGLIDMIDYLVDKVAEGKTVSVVDQTELWSVTQAAKELGVTRPTVYKMYERGDIQGVSLDGLKIVPSSAVAYMKKQESVKAKALAELHEIDMQLRPETRELVSGKDTSEYFEEVDVE